MASLAQYSAALHDAPSSARPAPGRGSRLFGMAVYAATAALVIAAALQNA